jgi:hypothetical protein
VRAQAVAQPTKTTGTMRPIGIRRHSRTLAQASVVPQERVVR